MSFGSFPSVHLGNGGDRLISSSSSSSVSSAPYHDFLTVFQAAPLVVCDIFNQYHPVGLLDFEEERQILTESLNEGHMKIDVVFDVATTDRLGAFLAKGEGRVLHFSCHGHPQYLAIEDGWGAMRPLLVEDLRDWIQAGGRNLQFVFVSACYSRTAGEAFVQAGVPHVVCCQQDDQQIRNAAAVEFARAFYHALACGKLLSEAFELGRHQVMNSLQLDRTERKREVEKFVLLPEGANHDVPIYPDTLWNNNHRRALSRRVCSSSSSLADVLHHHLPVPPHVFEGRQVDMFRVLDALKSARLVRVTGPPGIGKCSVVQGLCHYLRDRRHPISKNILWFPAIAEEEGEDDDSISRMIRDVCAFFWKSGEGVANNKKARQRLLTHLRDRKSLVVIDVRRTDCLRSMAKICTFLEDMVHGTLHAKAIVIHQIDDSVAIKKLNCKESNVVIEPLDFQSTVCLFGKLCQHVSERRYADVSTHRELCSKIIPDGSPTDKPTTKRTSKIFKWMGEGNPAQIQHAAKSMTGEEFDRMITVASRKEQKLEFKSRVALEKRLSEINTEIENAVKSRDFMLAQDYQEQLDEMDLLRESLPDLSTLETLADGVKTDQLFAIQNRDFLIAAKLQDELDALEEKIKVEKDALFEFGEVPDHEDAKCSETKNETRAALEAKIMELEATLQDVCDENDFRKAREVDTQINKLKGKRATLPTREMLLFQVSELRTELKGAKEQRDWDLAESVYAKMQDTEKKLDAEVQAESRLEKEAKLPPSNAASLPGATAVNGPIGDTLQLPDDALCNDDELEDIDLNESKSIDGWDTQKAGGIPVAKPVSSASEEKYSPKRDPKPRLGKSKRQQSREPLLEQVARLPFSSRESSSGGFETTSSSNSVRTSFDERMRQNSFGGRSSRNTECPGCGITIQKIGRFGRRTPLTIAGVVHEGQCLRCNQTEQVVVRRRSLAPLVPSTVTIGADDEVSALGVGGEQQGDDSSDYHTAFSVVDMVAPPPTQANRSRNAQVSYSAPLEATLQESDRSDEDTFSSYLDAMPLASSSEGFLSNRMLLEQVVQETLSSMTVAATKVEVAEEEPQKKSKSRGKIRTRLPRFRRKKQNG